MPQDALNFNGIVEPLPRPSHPPRRPSQPRSASAAPMTGGAWTERVDPELTPHVEEILSTLTGQGYDVRVGDTTRTPAQQAEKVAAGYSKTLNSPHVSPERSRAVDLIVYEHGQPDWAAKSPAWKLIGEEAKKRGLGWGGEFKGLYDPGHIQLTSGATHNADGLNFDGIVEPAGAEDALNFDGIVEPAADPDTIKISSAPRAETTAPVASALPAGASYLPDEQRPENVPGANYSAVTVGLPKGFTDWTQVPVDQLAAEAIVQQAVARRIPEQFARAWATAQQKQGRLRIYDLQTKRDATTEDFLRPEVYDERTRTIQLHQELPQLQQLIQDYESSAGYLGRVGNVITDPRFTAGEAFLEATTPVAQGAAQGLDYASRPLAAVDAAVWSKLRSGNATGYDPLTDYAVNEVLTGKEDPAYAKNPLAEGVRHSETLRDINPHLPGLAGAVTEMATSPSNLIPLGVAKNAGKVARASKLGSRIAEGLEAARDARFAKAGRMLDIAGTPEKIAATAARPRLRMASATEGITGEGLEVGRQTRRIFKDGGPQPFVMDERGSIVSSALPEPASPTSAPRQWQHRDFGLVTQSQNQTGVKAGMVRVVDAQGREHVIQHAKGTGAGNQLAVPVKETAPQTAINSPTVNAPAADAFPVDQSLYARSPYSDLDPQEVLTSAVADQRARLTQLARFEASAARGVDPVTGKPLSPRGLKKLQERAASLQAESARTQGLVAESFGRDAAEAFNQRARQGLPASFDYDPRKGERGAVHVSEVAAGLGKLASKETALDLMNAPRTIVASVDYSAPLRQGAIQTLTEPRAAVKALRDMFRASLRKQNYEEIVHSIATHPDADLARRSGLYFATREAAQPLARRVPPALSQREEAFMSKLAGGLPLVKQSERAYTTYLDKLRMEVFSKYANELRSAGVTDPKEFQDVAHWLNIATGRGDIGDWGRDGGAILNAAFFAPRYTASRFQVLSPTTYWQMSPAARKIAMRKMVQYAGTVGTTLLLAKLAGAEVNLLGPAASDWLKIKIGNTRYDLGAGQQQNLRFVYRMGVAAKRAAMGQESEGKDQGSRVLANYVRSKLAPAPGAAVNLWQGKTVVGEKTTLRKEALRLVLPLMLQDLWEAYQEEGLTGAAKTTPAVLGVGVQNYGERKERK